jgi:hypothetical protein
MSSFSPTCWRTTIPSLSLPELPSLLGRVRDLSGAFLSGESRGFGAFRELTDLLLRRTVLHPSGGVKETEGPRADTCIVGGWGDPLDPLPLTNGRYLRLSLTLFRESTERGYRIKVADSAYQYQADRDGADWMFRYDFLRNPPEPHPASHLQLNAALAQGWLPDGMPLSRVHFPTDRISFEAVIRLLIDQFAVPSNGSADVWRPLLAESEALFLGIRHRSLSGPSS